MRGALTPEKPLSRKLRNISLSANLGNGGLHGSGQPVFLLSAPFFFFFPFCKITGITEFDVVETPTRRRRGLRMMQPWRILEPWSGPPGS